MPAKPATSSLPLLFSSHRRVAGIAQRSRVCLPPFQDGVRDQFAPAVAASVGGRGTVGTVTCVLETD